MLALLLASAITLVSPENGATYDTHLQALKKYLANSDARSEYPSEEILAAKDADGNHYVHNAWFLNLLDEASVEQATYKPFAWEKTGDITDIVVQYSEDADFTDGKVLNEAYCRDNATATRPLNLKLATKYWWRVKAKDENGDEVVSDVRTFTTKGDAPRIIGTLGFNMRDLGGGKNAEGLTVRQGLILRGKCPMARVNGEAGWNDEKMTEESYREFYVNKHHIRTELDFRSADEALEHQTKYDEIEIFRIGIEHFNMEIYPYHYGHALTSSNICRAVKMLAEGTHYPVYFNCAVGSDRTGTFGTIIDGIVGRDDQWFYDNYELPSFDSGLARLRYNRKASEMFEYLRPRNPGEHFRDRVVQYLLGIGVTREEIRAIRAAMLELPPEGDARELKSAKAVYTEADQTLTLRYDDQDYSGVDGQLQCGLSRGGWVALTNDVRHLVFAPSFAGYRVEDCLQWFEDFKFVQDVTGLANFDTSLTTRLRGMFTGCSALTEFDFSGHDLPKCTNLGNMFYKCSGLKSVDFTGVATTNVTDFYRMFSGCSSLATIYAGEEFDASGYTDLTKEVFKGCSKLVGGAGTKFSSEHVNVEYARLDNPTDGKPGYFTLKGAEPVNPPVDPDPPVNPPVNPPDNPDPPEEPEEESWDDPDADLPEDTELAARAVRIGDTIRFYYDKKSHANNPEAVVSVVPVNGSRTWYNPSSDDLAITNVIFYPSFKAFKPKSMSGWFYSYRGLKNVIGLANVDTTEVTSMRRLFGCKSYSNAIPKLDLSTWDTSNCTVMYQMFNKCGALTTIYVGDKFDVSKVTDSTGMFADCKKLVGGAGTVYSATYKDKAYAKVDGGADDPGYFTYKAPPVVEVPEPEFFSGSGALAVLDSALSLKLQNCVAGVWYVPFYTFSLVEPDWIAGVGVKCGTDGEVLTVEVGVDKSVHEAMFVKVVASRSEIPQGTRLSELEE